MLDQRRSHRRKLEPVPRLCLHSREETATATTANPWATQPTAIAATTTNGTSIGRQLVLLPPGLAGAPPSMRLLLPLLPPPWQALKAKPLLETACPDHGNDCVEVATSQRTDQHNDSLVWENADAAVPQCHSMSCFQTSSKEATASVPQAARPQPWCCAQSVRLLLGSKQPPKESRHAPHHRQGAGQLSSG